MPTQVNCQVIVACCSVLSQHLMLLMVVEHNVLFFLQQAWTTFFPFIVCFTNVKPLYFFCWKTKFEICPVNKRSQNRFFFIITVFLHIIIVLDIFPIWSHCSSVLKRKSEIRLFKKKKELFSPSPQNCLLNIFFSGGSRGGSAHPSSTF